MSIGASVYEVDIDGGLNLILNEGKKLVMFDAVFDNKPRVMPINDTQAPDTLNLLSIYVAYNCEGDNRNADDIKKYIISRVKDRFRLHFTDRTRVNIILVNYRGDL